MDSNACATRNIIFWFWTCDAKIICCCGTVTFLRLCISNRNFLELDFYRVYIGLDCSNIFGHINSLRRLIFMGIYNKKRHIGMGCIFNNGRDWNNHCVNNQHLLGLTSSNVCDFNYWFTCVCRSYRIRHAEYQNSISAACSPR